MAGDTQGITERNGAAESKAEIIACDSARSWALTVSEKEGFVECDDFERHGEREEKLSAS